MNKQLRNKTRLFSLNAVTLLLAVVAVLFLGGPSVQAQTSTETKTITPADSPVVDSSLTLSTRGTVNDPGGAITVSGSVVVDSRRVLDNTSVASPIVVLDIDFSGLKGTSGNGKTLKTYVTGNNRTTELRPLQASDTIIVTCPYFESTKDGLSARTMLITATLNFDISTGKLTSGSITIGNNVVTSAMVGGAESM